MAPRKPNELEGVIAIKQYKLEVYGPYDIIENLLASLHDVGAARVGNYDHVSSFYPVKGTWRPLENSRPYEGNINILSTADEYKMELRCPEDCLRAAIKAIQAIHPYEEPVINVIELVELD